MYSSIKLYLPINSIWEIAIKAIILIGMNRSLTSLNTLHPPFPTTNHQKLQSKTASNS